MNESENELSISIARRQKRLLYWKKVLLSKGSNGSKLPDNALSKLKEQMDTFSQLLAKYPLIKDPNELKECELRLSTMERDFNSIFEGRRLLTTSIGLASISGDV